MRIQIRIQRCLVRLQTTYTKCTTNATVAWCRLRLRTRARVHTTHNATSNTIYILPIHHSRYDVVNSREAWRYFSILHYIHPCTAVMACRTFSLRTRASMMSQRANIRRRLVHKSTKHSTLHSLIIIMSAVCTQQTSANAVRPIETRAEFRKESHCVIDIKHARIKSI